jgi:potassium inwardly-rectifying channel subfamily J
LEGSAADPNGNGNDPSTTTTIETTHFISRQVKLLHPDENYGSQIWLGLPQVVVHRMDEASPLIPSTPKWYDAEGVAHDHPKSKNEKDPSQHDPLTSPKDRYLTSDMDDIESFLMDRDAEIVVLVEGTDEGTGAATQARHSYKATDLAWNHTFVPCTHPYSNNRRGRGRSNGNNPVCTIDFSKFHDIVPAPTDCEACAYVPQ